MFLECLHPDCFLHHILAAPFFSLLQVKLFWCSQDSVNRTIWSTLFCFGAILLLCRVLVQQLKNLFNSNFFLLSFFPLVLFQFCQGHKRDDCVCVCVCVSKLCFNDVIITLWEVVDTFFSQGIMSPCFFFNFFSISFCCLLVPIWYLFYLAYQIFAQVQDTKVQEKFSKSNRKEKGSEDFFGKIYRNKSQTKLYTELINRSCNGEDFTGRPEN